MKRYFPTVILLLVLLSLGSTTFVFGQRKRPSKAGSVSVEATVLTPSQSTPEALRRFDAFSKVWSTLEQNYFDPTFSNLDWYKIKKEYEPRVRSAKTDAALHQIIQELIGRLGRSHLILIPPEVYQAINLAKSQAKKREMERRTRREVRVAGGDNDEPDNEDLELDDPLTEYGIGVDLRIISGQFVVSRVDKDSAAEYRGIKPGYIIEKVNDISLTDLIGRIDLLYSNSARLKRYLPFEVITSFLNGEKDSVVTLTYVDETGSAKEVSIRRERLNSSVVSMMRGMPERHLTFETRVLPGDIGYIRFNYFVLPVLDRFCDALGEFKDKKGIVIDLRGNFGGLMALMPTLAGMLSENEVDLGTAIYRRGEEKMTSLPKPRNFGGNVVFLVDAHSISAAEIFSAAMQAGQRSFIVGEKTAGESLPSVALELPTGAVLQYPIANFKTSKGQFLEGSGVLPDFQVSLTRAALLQGKDEQLEKAIELVRTGKKPEKTEKNLGLMAAPSLTLSPPKKVQGAPPPNFSGPVNKGVDPPPPPPAIGRRFTIKGDAAVPPPAPPPRAKVPAIFTAPVTGSGSSSGSNSPTNELDPKAFELIEKYVKTIGGSDRLKAIEKYELTGSVELNVRGSRNEFVMNIVRDGNSKYAEILSSPSAGEIRETYNGKMITLQTDYGLLKETPRSSETIDTDILAPIRDLTDRNLFLSLKYQGIFPREGGNVHLLDGKTKTGKPIAFAFDVETGMLVNYTTASYFSISFGDYRREGDLTLPYMIDRENFMKITLDDIKINQPIDPSKFSKKERCFDRAN